MQLQWIVNIPIYMLMGSASWMLWSIGGMKFKKQLITYGIMILFSRSYLIIIRLVTDFPISTAGTQEHLNFYLICMPIFSTILGLMIILVMNMFWKIQKTSTFLFVPFLIVACFEIKVSITDLQFIIFNYWTIKNFYLNLFLLHIDYHHQLGGYHMKEFHIKTNKKRAQSFNTN